MNTKKSVKLIIVNDSILDNTIGDTYSSFFISNLNNLGYDVAGVIIIPSNTRIIIQEIQFSNKEYDITIIISNLSKGIINQALGKLFRQDLKRNEQLGNILKKKGISCNEEELLTIPYQNILEGEKYPLIHLQRIFLIHEKYMDSIFRSILKEYLTDYQKPTIFKKIANLYLNGNSGELDNLNYGSVRFELTKSSSNTVQLKYESESLEDLLEFEDDLRHLVFVSSSIPVLHDYVYSDMNVQVNNAIQVIETCFEKYGPENTFISFNGGKDCTVLLHLMLAVLEKHYPCHSRKLICLYVQGTQPFPEQEEFIDICQQFYSLDVIRLQMDIKNALKITLRDYPNLKACFMGTRRTDPFSNSLNEFQMTDKGYPEVMRVSPILNWSYFHIWDYLLYYKIPYCKLYDMGYTSLGNVDNTLKNSSLLFKDVLDGEERYLPAYKLLQEDSERSGRNG